MVVLDIGVEVIEPLNFEFFLSRNNLVNIKVSNDSSQINSPNVFAIIVASPSPAVRLTTIIGIAIAAISKAANINPPKIPKRHMQLAVQPPRVFSFPQN